jgi:succinate-acetate transporter protein
LNAGLGGTPTIVPDVPLAVIFLILYLIFGVIHIKIFKGNKHRGHKFIFNGAILGMLSPYPSIGMVTTNMSQVSARFGSLPCPYG